MVASAERLLRPLLAFAALCLAAFLLSPTVASVHRMVEDLDIDRDVPFHLWKWEIERTPPDQPDCGGAPKDLWSEINQWPTRIEKDEGFTLRGIVALQEDHKAGVALIDVDLFLNETKSEPGVHLGEVRSEGGGWFSLTTTIPFDMQATRYHIVAHAKQKRIGCQLYREHWSDPEMDVVSSSKIEWVPPEGPVAGRGFAIEGRVVDSVGGPVKNATVKLTIDGERHSVKTDEAGRFIHPYRPAKAGDVLLSAEYAGNSYYSASKNSTTIRVHEELFSLAGQPIVALRGTPFTLSGHAFLADSARRPTLTATLEGVEVVACDGCAPSSTIEVPVDAQGAFQVDLTVPSSETPGLHKVTFSGGGLKRSYPANLTVEVAPTLLLEARGTSLFARDLEARFQLVDEAGRPLPNATLAVTGPTGAHELALDAEGRASLAGKAPECGPHRVDASYPGRDHVRPASASGEANVCTIYAFIPPWLLAIPWWVWPLALLAGLAAWRAVRAWRERYAPVILGGPALTLAFTEPADEPAGYAAPGERVVATAFLEEPLPDGHRLRMGTHRDAREVPLDAELRAELEILPEKLGGIGVRAEILDEKGRVVSRRSLTLRVVRYAQEIERRYLDMRAKSGASDAVTPREFERWLHERAPTLEPAVVARLVRIFEEADYSPRDAGRADFAAYLAAEQGVEQEVSPRATVA